MSLYATIYVHSPLEKEELKRFILSLRDTIPFSHVEVMSVMTNKLPPGMRYSDPDGDFVDFPYRLEVGLDEIECTKQDAVDTITKVVRALKDSGFSAVPACDYEEDLPEDVRWVDPDYRNG